MRAILLILVFSLLACTKKEREVTASNFARTYSFGPSSIKPNGHAIVLGSAYNAVTGEIKAPCVEPTPGSLIPAAANVGDVRKDLETTESRLELRSNLSQHVEASVGIGPFKADADYDYVNNHSISSFDNSLLVHVWAYYQPQGAASWRKTRHFVKDVAPKGEAAIATECGTSFVDNVTRGGEFFAILRIHNDNSTEFSNTKKQAGLNIGSYVSGKATFQQALTNIISGRQLKLFMIRTGKMDSLADVADLTNAANAFPANIPPLATASIMNATLQTYGTLLGTSAGDQFKRQHRYLAELSSLADSARTARDNFAFVQSEPKQFRFANVDEAGKGKASAIAYINSIEDAATDCSQDLSKCKDAPPFPDLPRLPERIRAVDLTREICNRDWNGIEKYVSVRAELGQLRVYERAKESALYSETANPSNEILTSIDNGHQYWGATPIWDEARGKVYYRFTSYYTGIAGEAVPGTQKTGEDYFGYLDCTGKEKAATVQPDGGLGWEFKIR